MWSLLPLALAASGSLRLETRSPLLAPGSMARVIGADGLQVVLGPGEARELEPGTYLVELLTDPPLTRKGVVVPAEGEVVVRFEELGGLKLAVLGADGQPVVTVADVFLLDGRKVASVASGDARTMVAGTYRVVLRTNPNRVFEKVAIAPGQVADLRVSLAAELLLDVRGPGGSLPRVHARFRHPGGGDVALANGESMSLPAGSYDLLIDTVPPSRQAIDLVPGKRVAVQVADLGHLQLDLRDPGGRPVESEVTVLDPGNGLVLAHARNGQTLALRAGTYRVRFEAAAGGKPLVREGVVVRAARTRIVGRPSRG